MTQGGIGIKSRIGALDEKRAEDSVEGIQRITAGGGEKEGCAGVYFARNVHETHT